MKLYLKNGEENYTVLIIAANPDHHTKKIQ